MIPFDPTKYFLGVWFIPNVPEQPTAQQYNFLAAVWREDNAGPWKLAYRVRYRELPPGEAQEPWFFGQIGAQMAAYEIEEKMVALMTIMAEASGATAVHVPVHGPGDLAWQLLLRVPGWTARKATPDELEQGITDMRHGADVTHSAQWN